VLWARLPRTGGAGQHLHPWRGNDEYGGGRGSGSVAAEGSSRRGQSDEGLGIEMIRSLCAETWSAGPGWLASTALVREQTRGGTHVHHPLRGARAWRHRKRGVLGISRRAHTATLSIGSGHQRLAMDDAGPCRLAARTETALTAASGA